MNLMVGKGSNLGSGFSGGRARLVVWGDDFFNWRAWNMKVKVGLSKDEILEDMNKKSRTLEPKSGGLIASIECGR